MDSNLNHVVTYLSRGALLRRNVVDGQVVTVFKGLVWITQDGDPRDVFVAGGESFAVDRPGLALVEAFEPSVLLVSDAQTRRTADELAFA